MIDEIADYLLDNYGICDRGANCYWGNGCLKTGWRGRLCPHWQPLGATSLEALSAGQPCVIAYSGRLPPLTWAVRL